MYTLWNLEWMIKVIVDQRDRIIKGHAYITLKKLSIFVVVHH